MSLTSTKDGTFLLGGLWSSSSKPVATIALYLLLASSSTVAVQMYMCQTDFQVEAEIPAAISNAFSDLLEEEEDITDQIDAIVNDPSMREPDEPSPTVQADTLKGILKGSAKLLSSSVLPEGDVSLFCEELSVTWRSGLRILSLIVGSNGQPKIHFGTMSDAGPGEYSYEPLEGPEHLARKISWLDNSRALTAKS